MNIHARNPAMCLRVRPGSKSTRQDALLRLNFISNLERHILRLCTDSEMSQPVTFGLLLLLVPHTHKPGLQAADTRLSLVPYSGPHASPALNTRAC